MQAIDNINQNPDFDAVTTCFIKPNQTLPLVIEDSSGEVDLLTWASAHQQDILACQLKFGALLFRGFKHQGEQVLEPFIGATSKQAISYTERSSPRDQVHGNIYTSTSHRADQPIFLHNEQSYNLQFPRCIYFYCDTPSQTGGQTPLADTRKVLARIADTLQCKLIDKGYLYQRNFNRSFGLSWQESYQNDDEQGVSDYCEQNQIDYQWHQQGDIDLTTSQHRQVIAVHPLSGEKCWFNHCTFFNHYTLDKSIQQALEQNFSIEQLPNDTLLGDGTRLSEYEVEQLKQAYSAEKVSFDWQKGDVLMVDNMLCSHGREPFTGERRVLVGMSDVYQWSDVEMVDDSVLEL